ncbi:hypothetical protein LSCM1_07824 [Leishmania martiniquensis]|uniref:Uncharacterized protein n=1 Tax=Leishmania martiniquensis TaxID=1580590 RepID=A0A836HHX1_9TRYP|nr:hypothetical protein LSCM1_07824 [Leishmania martiniquensis]
MSYGTLVLCTSVLYAPHTVLCGLALLQQPMLIVMSIVAALLAFAPLVMTGLIFQVLRRANAADGSTAAWVVVIHFVLQNAARVGALHVCLRLQRLGLRHGLLLVHSWFPLVPVSIAVGAGFAASSLLVSGGALLAEAWDVGRGLGASRRTPATSAGAAKEFAPFSSSGSCAQLPLIVQSCFQQSFFTCGQVAWTVMMGQAYAVLDRQDGAEDLLGQMGRANSADDAAIIRMATATEAEEAGDAVRTRALRERAETVRQDAGELLRPHDDFAPALRDCKREAATHAVGPGRAYTGATPMSREEAAVHQPVPWNAVGSESGGAGAVADTTPSAVPFASEAARSPTVAQPQGMPSTVAAAAWPAAGSVFAQRLPAAALTGTAALVLHAVLVLLPLTEMATDSASAQRMSTLSSDRRSSGCLASIPLQCAVTLVSVGWGLWIVELERHPSTYMLL